MKNLLTISIIAIFLISCEKENTDDSITLLEKFDFNYLNETPITQNDSYIYGRILLKEPFVEISYENSQPVKLIGGLISLPSATGYSYQTSSLVYKNIEYNNSIVNITENIQFNDFDLNPILEGKCQLFYENNILKKRINENIKTTLLDNDTTYYSYDANNRITEAIVYQYDQKTINTFKFNTNKNLQRVDFKTQRLSDSQIISEGFHQFSDFDKAVNLFSNLGIFNNLYFRSLSNNNYRKYHFEKKEFNTDLSPVGIQISSKTLEWTIDYDKKGLPIYTTPF